MTQPVFRRACDAFGLSVPIYQAPTGSIAGPELATAVCRAGAMGALALTWSEPALAADAVRKVRASTSGPFLVNFALAFRPDALEPALDAGAPVVSFSWGDPEPYMKRVFQAGAKVGIQVTNIAGTRRARDLGAHFLICQGLEAGGHVQSSAALNDLLPAVLEAADGIPVIAAGGIGDGIAIAAALNLGAAGAMLGTRFVATRESRAHPEYKEILAAAGHKETALTVCFDGGWPYAAHRVVRNGTLEAWEERGSPSVGMRPGEGEIVGRSATGEPILRYEDTAPRAGMTGDVLEMCLYAGQGVDRIEDIPAAGELVHRLWRECEPYLTME